MFGGKGWAPHSIKNLTIVYYVEKIGGPADQSILHQHLTYKFEEGGTYTCYYENGSFFESGDYSYFKTSPNKCRIVLSYMMNNNSYIYQFEMNYESATSGKWNAQFSTNPDDLGEEGGTFQVKQ
jgi:hypothetical protein